MPIFFSRLASRLPRPNFTSLAIAFVLLALLGGILLLPAIETTRSIELEPDNTGITLFPSNSIFSILDVPAGNTDHYLTWIKTKSAAGQPDPALYQSLQLEIRAPDDSHLRTATTPRLIKRAEHLALLFTFDTIHSNHDQQLLFRITNQGDHPVSLQQASPAHIHPEEATAIALQLGQRRTWGGLLFDKAYHHNVVNTDISFYLHRGQQIAQGQNPYSCVLDEAESCLGYPAHFPGMYWFAAGFASADVDELTDWIAIWRPISFASMLAVGLVLAGYLYRHGYPALAVASLGFWLLNRWSIEVLRIAHTDFLGVLFLLLAVILVIRKPLLAALLLGVSLSIKQLAIVIVPLFLIMVWRTQKYSLLKMTGVAFLTILVPLLALTPFLLNDAPATIQGILYPLERPSQTVHGFAPSLGQLLDITNFSKNLPMLLLVGMVYLSAWRRSLTLASGTLLIFAILIGFSPVLYNQYMVWLLPFVPLAAVRFDDRHRQQSNVKSPPDSLPVA